MRNILLYFPNSNPPEGLFLSGLPIRIQDLSDYSLSDFLRRAAEPDIWGVSLAVGILSNDQLAGLESMRKIVSPSSVTQRFWQQEKLNKPRIPDQINHLEEPESTYSSLKVYLARSPFGQIAVWSLIKKFDRSNGSQFLVISPSQIPSAISKRLIQKSIELATELNLIGVLSITFARQPAGNFVCTEITPSLDADSKIIALASTTGVVEQQLRAIMDYPLGSTELLATHTIATMVKPEDMIAMSLDERVHHLSARFPEIKLSLHKSYGREPEIMSSKSGSSTEQVWLGVRSNGVLNQEIAKLGIAANWVQSARWQDGWSIH